MTADGKIADYNQSPARFGSSNDQLHLQQQVALVDGVIFGANTLRAYGTTLSVSNPQLIEARKKRSQSPQPAQIVVSASGNFNTNWRFFQQPVPRWLLTTPATAAKWRGKSAFERIITTPGDRANNSSIDLLAAFKQLSELGLTKLAVLGGGELVAASIELNLIDELWLTVCPIILGGRNAPTPVGGQGFLESAAKKLNLLEVKQVESEVFLHYSISNNC